MAEFKDLYGVLCLLASPDPQVRSQSLALEFSIDRDVSFLKVLHDKFYTFLELLPKRKELELH